VRREEEPKTQAQIPCLGHPAEKARKSRSLHYAARRAKMRRGRENRAAPVRMTIPGRQN